MQYTVAIKMNSLFTMHVCSMEPDTKEEEAASYESLTTAAISVMRRKLPGYVVECLVAAGYDTLAAIGNMDISHEAGNSIQLIEEYINSTHPNDPKFMRTNNMAATTFKIPPGHRQTIETFVKEIRQQEDEKTRRVRKRVSESSCAVPKRKLAKAKETSTYSGKGSSSSSSVDVAPRTQASTAGYIRQQVVKWQRLQKDVKLRELKELEQYEVHVKCKEVGDDLAASIHCKVCHKSYSLGHKEGRVMISNWTKHITKCIQTSKCHGSGVTRTIRQYLQLQTEEPNSIVEDEQHFRLSPPT